MRHTVLSRAILLAAGWFAGAALAATCSPSAITPALKQGSGSWAATSAVTTPAGTPLVLGPQAAAGGSWTWRGCGTQGTAREQALVAKASCTATVVHTNACGATSTQSFAVTVPGMRDLTSVQLSRLMGAGWNLGNALEAIGGETAWGNPPATQALFHAVRAAGFKSVRIPVSWKQYADANDNISPSWMARVAQVVGYARAAGLVTIINVHWDSGWLQPTYAQQPVANARLAKFWTQIATHFRQHDDMLLFAGTNEVMVEGDYGPPSAENIAVQNGFNQVFVDAVRATGGNNLARHLVVQGYNTNIDLAYQYAALPADSVAGRLFMEVHYYDPYNFTLNAYSNIWQWGAIATDPGATETWADEAYAEAQFNKMKSRFVDNGVGVILGEYGAILRSQAGSDTYRTYWDQTITRTAWQRGVVPMVWDNGGTGVNGMGLFNRATGVRVHANLVKAIVNAAK